MSAIVPNQAFNLTLEILQGCKYQCVGCMVDRDFDPGPFDNDRERLISLVDQMADEGYRLREFTVGPVDVIASKAGIEILDHPLVKDLAQRYESIVLPLALLSDDGLEELCAKVNVLMAGKSFTLATPFPLKSTYNQKHQDLVKRRVDFVISHLPDVKFELLYLTVNMTGDSVRDFTPQANQDLHELDFGVRRLVEYVFPHVRRGFDDLVNRQLFLNEFGRFCDVIQECRDTPYNRYLIKPITDSLELTYRQGELFYTPTLIEKFPIFDKQFVLDEPWSPLSIEEFYERQYINELVKWSSDDLCKSCPHLNRCSRGDVHAIMSHLSVGDCLVNMRNKWDVLT